jgi:hypothetical protein
MLDLTRLGLGCPSSVTSGSLEVSGTWSAHADSMTISDDTTTTGEQAFWLEPACLLISGTSTTCDRLAMPLQQLGYASVTCTSGPGCNCAASVEQAGGMAFATRTPTTYGTYTTAGNLLTTTSDGSNDRQYSYCVSGKTLTMSPMVDDTQGDPLAGQPSGTIVLQKQ